MGSTPRRKQRPRHFLVGWSVPHHARDRVGGMTWKEEPWVVVVPTQVYERFGAEHRHQASANSAIDAVKPCRKFFPPTGPISPAQLNPASGRPPSILETSDAS
jgi:hypothetical protein